MRAKKSFTRIIIITMMSFLIFACRNEQENKANRTSSDTVDTAKTISSASKTLTLPFIAVVDSNTTRIELQANPQKSKVPLNKEELAEALNIKYPEIKLELGKTSHDTLLVNIPSATFLTQQMGTTGALTYLAEATYAFTDLANIKVVNFVFKEGDHAVPGPYTRKSFNTKNI
ncbi:MULTISPECIES: hypothetical protein [Olivibacter]|uniref:Sporulation and spore germination protein n=1 Tax=Olivibacter oleidegradans TaxID=760123 RepID=A0ABV6HSR0_9SPHI|nr:MULTISPECIES: hypothetical protein [Olivibacter]MDM8173861.1 hypothetical protein [Olivibacter sp. 47]